jgi:preprotein translocase subunit SecE
MAEAKAEVKTKEKKPGFFKGVRLEWNKIIWTQKEDLARQTALVVFVSVVMGAVIAVVDSGALRLIDLILNIG